MTERERLTALILECGAIHECGFDPDKRVSADKLAGFLIKNGVILPPCKVGDTVWVYNQNNGNIYENKVDGIYVTGVSGWKNTVRLEYKNRFGEVQYRKFAWNQIGKSVFLTREDAEAALKKRRKEGDAT